MTQDTLLVPNPPHPSMRLTKRQRSLLLLAAAVSSMSGLAVELLLGTLSSYLVGNQALSFGVAVGVFLAAMGLGAYLSQFVARSTDNPVVQHQQLQLAFVLIELAIAPLSLILPLAMFALFVVGGPFWIGLFLCALLLGGLSGLEVPLLTRLLEPAEGVRDALAGVLALDYLGALVGSLAFPIILLPTVGMFPAAALIGSLPAWMVFIFGWEFPQLRHWRYWGLGLAVLLCVLAPITIPIGDRLENTLYKAPIISRIQSPYQRVVLTRRGQDVRLFLDGDLQLSTLDEYRYHEALVHPALSANLNRNSTAKRRVLVMGAGDGMALREVLKWKDVERIVLIDLDQSVINLARRHPALVQVNQNALANPRVEVRIGDAFTLVPALTETFDVIIADFPDPDRDNIAKLYSQGFYQRVLPHLTEDGVFVTQASSPFFAPRAFACIAATLESVGLKVNPYVIDVPSFGPWGFVLASRSAIQRDRLTLPVATRFLTPALLPTLFNLPGDIQLGQVEINRLIQPVIVRYQQNAHWAD